MRIKTIEFENFRNFKEYGKIECSTDGKTTIIYGKNGDGKTTLHQLFHWIFYGEVHFNKTATDHLYNLEYEESVPYGKTFKVLGKIEFVHDNLSYLITRAWTYKKNIIGSEIIARDFSILKNDDDNNWKSLNNPKELIDILLPKGLADYFFFDGETMIADLRVKGKDSAEKLKKALYSMFDLDVIESAISHIGRTDLKTTVLGKLFLSKGNISCSGDISSTATNIKNLQKRIEEVNDSIDKATKEKNSKYSFINSVSEQIGNRKSKADYEKQRKELQDRRDLYIKNAENSKGDFGEDVIDMFPRLFISKAVDSAKEQMNLKISQNKLPFGMTKKLVEYLLSEKTINCICGNPLCDKSKEHIRNYLQMLPPNSFESLYNEFVATAKKWGKDFDKDRIEKHILMAINNTEHAEECDKQIKELDEIEKNSPDIENLVVERAKAESDITCLDKKIIDLQLRLKVYSSRLKQEMTLFDNLTKATEHGKKIDAQINIMEQVLDYFKKQLKDATDNYSKKLKKNIQDLTNAMLTSKRTVYVNSDFSVRVTDSHNDESKSEGQFAVVSFAYIGGILKMLQSECKLASKEYPLVLDGPFSKLDEDQKRNVINNLPDFAPQVILFSKDDLHGVFPPENIGRVWTIESNHEKNVAKITEGYLWK